jgi:hypothetical protein
MCIFHVSGKTPSEKHLLNMVVIGEAKAEARFLRKICGTQLGVQAFVVDKFNSN